MTYEQSRNTICFPWEKDYLGSKDSSKEAAIEPGAQLGRYYNGTGDKRWAFKEGAVKMPRTNI